MDDFLAAILGFGIVAVCFIAWLTHVFWCFANAAWGFLLASASSTADGCGSTNLTR